MKLVRCALDSDNWQGIVDNLERVTVGITLWDAHDVSPAVSRTACYRGTRYRRLRCLSRLSQTTAGWTTS